MYRICENKILEIFFENGNRAVIEFYPQKKRESEEKNFRETVRELFGFSPVISEAAKICVFSDKGENVTCRYVDNNKLYTADDLIDILFRVKESS